MMPLPPTVSSRSIVFSGHSSGCLLEVCTGPLILPRPIAFLEKLRPARPVLCLVGLDLPGMLKMASPACFHPTLNTISLQNVILEQSGGMPEMETHQKNSNIISTHAKRKYQSS